MHTFGAATTAVMMHCVWFLQKQTKSTSLTGLAEGLYADHLGANLKPQLVLLLLICVPEPGLI